MPPGEPRGGASPPPDLERLIADARRRLPSSHRALLEQIGVQDAVVDDWPHGVQAYYETLHEAPPSGRALSEAVAVWLQEMRVVAYNAPLLLHALGDATPATRQAAVDHIAWHEYGHALSAALASPAARRAGPALLELLPPGIRAAIDYPGTYARHQVFDEVIAHVYALMVGRAVKGMGYGSPSFLHADVYEAFTAVVPWPPESP